MKLELIEESYDENWDCRIYEYKSDKEVSFDTVNEFLPVLTSSGVIIRKMKINDSADIGEHRPDLDFFSLEDYRKFVDSGNVNFAVDGCMVIGKSDETSVTCNFDFFNQRVLMGYVREKDKSLNAGIVEKIGQKN